MMPGRFSRDALARGRSEIEKRGRRGRPDDVAVLATREITVGVPRRSGTVDRTGYCVEGGSGRPPWVAPALWVERRGASALAHVGAFHQTDRPSATTIFLAKCELRCTGWGTSWQRLLLRIDAASRVTTHRTRLDRTVVTSNRFFTLEDELEPWALDEAAPAPWPECGYFGKLFAALDDLLPNGGWNFVLTNQVKPKYRLRGEETVVVCIRDELCRMPSYSHAIRLLGKTYGIKRAPDIGASGGRSAVAMAEISVQEMIVQARRMPSLLTSAFRTLRSGSRPIVMDVPLGTYLLDNVDFVPFDERTLDVSYAGSRFNREVDAYRRVPTRKVRSRRELERVIDEMGRTRPDVCLGVHIIERFQEAAAHREVYSRMLMDSRVALCPRGGSLETYRFFEAMCFGAIPITEQLPDRYFYTGSPAVRVRHWGELPAVLDRLLADPAAWRTRHEAALRWWYERCSPAAVAQRLAVALDRSLVR